MDATWTHDCAADTGVLSSNANPHEVTKWGTVQGAGCSYRTPAAPHPHTQEETPCPTVPRTDAVSPSWRPAACSPPRARRRQRHGVAHRRHGRGHRVHHDHRHGAGRLDAGARRHARRLPHELRRQRQGGQPRPDPPRRARRRRCRRCRRAVLAADRRRRRPLRPRRLPRRRRPARRQRRQLRGRVAAPRPSARAPRPTCRLLGQGRLGLQAGPRRSPRTATSPTP